MGGVLPTADCHWWGCRGRGPPRSGQRAAFAAPAGYGFRASAARPYRPYCPLCSFGQPPASLSSATPSEKPRFETRNSGKEKNIAEVLSITVPGSRTPVPGGFSNFESRVSVLHPESRIKDRFLLCQLSELSKLSTLKTIIKDRFCLFIQHPGSRIQYPASPFPPCTNSNKKLRFLPQHPQHFLHHHVHHPLIDLRDGDSLLDDPLPAGAAVAAHLYIGSQTQLSSHGL